MKRVAVLGASSDRSKFGNKSLRAHRHAGWEAIPVNPGDGEIEGEAVYRDLASIPGELDRITVYLPPPLTRALLPEIARRSASQERTAEVWLNPGSADAATVAAARELGIAAIDGCSIVDLGLSPAQFPA